MNNDPAMKQIDSPYGTFLMSVPNAQTKQSQVDGRFLVRLPSNNQFDPVWKELNIEWLGPRNSASCIRQARLPKGWCVMNQDQFGMVEKCAIVMNQVLQPQVLINSKAICRLTDSDAQKISAMREKLKLNLQEWKRCCRDREWADFFFDETIPVEKYFKDVFHEMVEDFQTANPWFEKNGQSVAPQPVEPAVRVNSCPIQ